MTTYSAITLANILDTDAAKAVEAADVAVIAESVELAPLSYAAMREAKAAGTLAALLARVPANLLRAQAVRFLVERKAATGAGWGWGDVDTVAERFARVAEQQTTQQTTEVLVSDETVEVRGDVWTVARRSACGRLVLASNGRSLAYERFAVLLDGELHTAIYANPRTAWEYGERWLAQRLDEEAWAAAVAEHGPDGAAEALAAAELAAPEPAVIEAAVPVSADAVEAVLRRREEEAVGERGRASTADGARFAEERRRALSRARQALTRAARAGRTLATELLSGGWQVAGNGGLYTVRRDGLALACTCPHGTRTAAGEAAAGICYHSELIAAVEEATDETVAERDARAVYALAA